MNPGSESTETSIKALQAQNAQFQELILGLAKGQEELKTMLLKKERKKKRRTVLFNSGRRLGNTLHQEEAVSSVGKSPSQAEARVPSPVVSDNETDFDEEQYPPEDNKYKQLEDRLKAMEVQIGRASCRERV